MKLKNVIVTSLILLTAGGVTSLDAQTYEQPAFYIEPGTGFVPISPRPVVSKVAIPQNGEIVCKDIRVLSTKEALDYLVNARAHVSVSKIESGFNISYLAGSIARTKGHYRVYMDYTKYVTEDVNDADPSGSKNMKDNVQYRIGVGLRIAARVETKKKNVDLGGLFKIGFAAGRNDLTGSLQVEVIGVTSAEIDSLVPGLLGTIDEGAIQNIMESMAAIKAKFRDPDTIVKPHYLAWKASDAFITQSLRIVDGTQRGKRTSIPVPRTEIIRAPSIR